MVKRKNGAIVVRMTAVERLGLWKLAEGRQRPKDKRLARDNRHKNDDDVGLHYVGLKGEYAVAKFLGLELDMSETVAGDRRGDFQVGDLWFEVKNAYRNLLLSPNELGSEFVVMVKPQTEDTSFATAVLEDREELPADHRWANVEIVGWLSSRLFYQRAKVRDFGYGDRYYVSPNELREPYKLFRILDGIRNGDIGTAVETLKTKLGDVVANVPVKAEI